MHQYFNITHSFITSLSRRRDGAGAAIDDVIEERDLATVARLKSRQEDLRRRSLSPLSRNGLMMAGAIGPSSPQHLSPRLCMLSLLPRARSAAVRGIAPCLVWLDGAIFHVYLLLFIHRFRPVARRR
jgi:hypothetical protein